MLKLHILIVILTVSLVQSPPCRKEKLCDFCAEQLPDWRQALTPGGQLLWPAVMNVNFGGHTYSFEAQAGVSGYQQFTQAIRTAFSLPLESVLNITFTCDDPTSGASRGGGAKMGGAQEVQSCVFSVTGDVDDEKCAWIMCPSAMLVRCAAPSC